MTTGGYSTEEALAFSHPNKQAGQPDSGNEDFKLSGPFQHNYYDRTTNYQRSFLECGPHSKKDQSLKSEAPILMLMYVMLVEIQAILEIQAVLESVSRIEQFLRPSRL